MDIEKLKLSKKEKELLEQFIKKGGKITEEK